MIRAARSTEEQDEEAGLQNFLFKINVFLFCGTIIAIKAGFKKTTKLPRQADALIIGGGIMGSFVAYWLKKAIPSSNIVVVEKDSFYTKSSTFWSVGGFRQQFSLPENIEMSLFGAEFLRKVKENLNCGKENLVDLDFNQDGYLFLASKNTADLLYKNHQIQIKHGAKVKLLNKEELKSYFRWINTDDVELGSFGYMNEGWVDARKYLLAVRNAATYHGVNYLNGELIGFEGIDQEKDGLVISDHSLKPIKRSLVEIPGDKILPIDTAYCINAAGPWAGDVARLAGIGSPIKDNKQTIYSIGLPVEPRKRYIFMFYAENGPILNVPLTIDHSGVFFKRHGLSNYYICGLNQSEGNEPKNMDLNNIDYSYFEKNIKPVIIKRCPLLTNLKLVNAWSGYYEFNTLDQNLIIGKHPLTHNFIFANGSSGHGLQHAAAIGRAVSELIIHSQYKTINLTRFGFERVLKNEPLKEIDVV